jgi:hypothetical protein
VRPALAAGLLAAVVGLAGPAATTASAATTSGASGVALSARTAVASTADVAAPASVIATVAAAPAEAGRLILVPNLSRLAGRLNEFLAGINRVGLLMGADPVDQLMGLLGFSRHVDRFGAIGIAWVPRADDPGNPAILVLVPSGDPDAFLDVNFRPGPEAGTYLDASGRSLHARARDGHVLITAAADAAVLDQPRLGDAAPARLAALAAPIRSMLAEDDVILLARGEGLRSAPAPMLGYAVEALDRGLLTGPGAAVARTLITHLQTVFDPAAGPLPAAADAVSIGLRFDPLGLLARSHLAWREPVEVAGAAGDAGDAADGGDPLAGIPAGPAFLVGGWDRSSAGPTASIERLLDVLGLTVVPRWRGAGRLAMRVPVHEGAFATGLLAGGGLRVAGDAAVQAAGRAGPWVEIPGWSLEVMPPPAAADGTVGRWIWRRQGGGGGGGTPGAVMLGLLAGGPRGLNGPITATSFGGAAGIEAGTLDADGRPGRPFAGAGMGDLPDDFAVQLMRDLRPRRATLEAYVDVAAMSRWLAAAAASAPVIGRIEAIDARMPPVGLGLAADRNGVSGFAILPAPLAAEAWDVAAAAAVAGLADVAGAPAAADDDGR